MGGDNQDLEMENGSVVGSEGSSFDGLQITSLSSTIDGVPSEAQGGQDYEDEIVYVNGHADTDAAGGGASTHPRHAPEPSIQAHLENSTHGHLVKLNESLGINLNMKLPEVVVVGDESNGKTTTLARITLRPLFPSNYGMTTRCPIRLCLKYAPNLSTQRIYLPPLEKGGEPRDVSDVADLAPLLMEEMGRLCAGRAMTSDELVVQIQSAQVPNLELVDLPGVVARPEEMRVCSEELVRKYASAPHSLLLCVVDATMASLNNSRTLAMLEEMGRLGDTILVQPKYDNVPDNDLRFKSEMLGPEGKLVKGLAGAVGLMNPPHSQFTTEGLAAAEERERALFAARLPWLVYGRDVGIVALLSMLVTRMHHVIVTQWVPSAQAKVERRLIRLCRQVEMLGDAPHVYNGDVSRLFAQLCSGTPALLAKHTKLVERFLADNALSLARKGSRAEAYSVLNRSHVRERREEWLEVRALVGRLMADLQNAAMAHLGAVLRDEEPSVPNVEKLARFDRLRQACERVMEGLLEELGQAAWAEAKKTIDFHFQRMAGRALCPSFGTELFRAVAEAMVSELLVPLEDFYLAPSATHSDSGSGSGSGGGPLQRSDFQRRVEEPPSLSTSAEDGSGMALDVEGSIKAEWLRGLLTESDEVASRRAQRKASYDRHRHALRRLERMRDLQYGQALEGREGRGSRPGAGGGEGCATPRLGAVRLAAWWVGMPGKRVATLEHSD